MGVGERQQHALHTQLFGPARRQPAEPHIGPTIGRADDLDLAPADSPGRLASLQRLVDRFLGGEAYGHVGRGVRATLAVGALGRREQALEDARPFIGDDGGDARHFYQIDTDADRGHGPLLRSRGAPRATRGREGNRRAPGRAIRAPRRAGSTARPIARAKAANGRSRRSRRPSAAARRRPASRARPTPLRAGERQCGAPPASRRALPYRARSRRGRARRSRRGRRGRPRPLPRPQRGGPPPPPSPPPPRAGPPPAPPAPPPPPPPPPPP